MTKQANRPKKPGKQSTKNQNLQESPAPQGMRDIEAPPVGQKAAAATDLRTLAYPALFLLAFLVLWFAPPVKFDDPWNEGISLVNAARKISNPVEKKATLDKAGVLLKELERIHPYHARVQFNLAYYYDDAGDYDSSIVHAKEAIRLGSGAIVNSVDGIARDLLAHAAVVKSQPLVARKEYAAARKVLEDAYAIHPTSKMVITALGNLSIHEQSLDAAIDWFEKLAKIDPKDDETWLVLAKIAASQNRVPAAIGYAEKSLAINSQSAAARDLLARLKSSPAAGN